MTHVRRAENGIAVCAMPGRDCLAQERLIAIVMGMLRQNKYDFVDVYREEAATALKAVMKQTVIEAVSAVDDECSDVNVTSLGDQIRLLNYSRWMILLNQVFENLLVILNRVKAVCHVIQEVVQQASGQSPTDASDVRSGEPLEATIPVNIPSLGGEADTLISQAECVKLTTSLREMLCSCCDHAHDRCVKLLISRGKDGFLERLTSSEFVTLSLATESFVKDCELLCGRLSTSLRGSLQSQSNKFVNRFHEERRHKLSLILDNERWKQADVPAEFQDLVDHISKTGNLAILEKKSDPDKRPSEFLQVNGNKYAVVGTVLILLNMVVEYCQCVTDIPSVTQDILTRLVELLKMFNSRTCQLILGAGALKLVGLRTINTKNLALASRCLQLVIYFLPMVQSHFEKRLPDKQQHIIKHFQQVVKDYKDHIAEIDNKLISIMEKMFERELSKWEVKAPMPSSCFRVICKQMSKFHEACADLLPKEQIMDLFIQMTDCFKSQVSYQLVKFGLTNNGGPQHGLVTADLAFYIGSMRSLPGLQSMPDRMETVWQRR